jgi:hypothetical protein
MTDRISTSQRALTACTLHSNKLLWAGLLTVLAGAAMLAATQTYTGGHGKITLFTDESVTFGTDRSKVEVVACVSPIVGALIAMGSAVGICWTMQKNHRKGYRIAFAVTLAVGVATLLYDGLVLALGRNGSYQGVAYERHWDFKNGGWIYDRYYEGTVWNNQASLQAMRGISTTVMIAGAGAMGLGLIGWLAARKAAQQPHAPVGPSESLKGDPEALS